MAVAELRKALHTQGYQALAAGHYHESIEILEEAIRQHGPHVGVLADLAFNFWLLGDYGRFRLAVDRFEHELEAAGSLLGLENRIRALMALSKFCEELGRVSDTFEHISEAMRIIPVGHFLAVRARCQQLRVLASFGREAELSQSYRECLDVSESRPLILLECYHALLLAEARLFGMASVYPRLNDFCSRSEILASDLRLVVVDLLEVSLESGDLDASAKLVSILKAKGELDHLDPFEAAIVSLAGKEKVDADKLFQWTRTLTPMGRLRVLALTQQLRLGDDDLVRRQMALHLDSFDHASRKLVLHKWGKEFQAEAQLEIVIDCARKEILFNQRALELRKSAQTWDLIVALAGLPHECPPEQVLQALGKADSSHNQESLRISLLRLNKKLAMLLGLGWAVKFGKHRVSIHPQIRLKAV